jgi:UDP-glucose 4-epimerase
MLGEDPIGTPSNLMPVIIKVATGDLERLKIFGGDYKTKDGTAIRDYIHVVDLAKGHIKALENESDGLKIYNLGTGQGITVLGLVNEFIKVNKINIPYEIVSRRAGDIDISYADGSKARKEINWTACFFSR